MAGIFGIQVANTIRNGASVAPAITYPVYYLLERPDGTIEKLTVNALNTPETISVTVPGLYGVYAMGSVDPGTPTVIPTVLPLPDGAVYLLMPRYQYYEFNAADIGADLSRIVDDRYVDDTMNFQYADCTNYINDPLTEFLGS